MSTYNKISSQNKIIPSKWLSLKGCHANNLKNIDVEIPLNCMCSITGVSGSGKSSLVFHSLLPALEEKLKQNLSQIKIILHLLDLMLLTILS